MPKSGHPLKEELCNSSTHLLREASGRVCNNTENTGCGIKDLGCHLPGESHNLSFCTSSFLSRHSPDYKIRTKS